MLSRLVSRNLIRAFSEVAKSTSQLEVKAPEGSVSATDDAPKGSISELLRNELPTEQKHFDYYLSEMKSEHAQNTLINFEVEENNRTLILETENTGENLWKLGEVVALVGGSSFLYQLVGFPNYAIAAATLGVAGLGAALSYGNYLRRTAPQITQVYKLNDGRLQVHYLKPEGVLGQGSDSQSVEVASNQFRHVSFGCNWTNWVRKANDTRWVRLDGNLYWYNAGSGTLRVNSHNYHELL